MSNKKNEELIVVGIGASAGGLEALQAFISNLPDNANMAYIIAQHLSPVYKSMLTELLNKESPIQVLEATSGLSIKKDTIYVCPPNKNITVQENVIMLSDPTGLVYTPKPSVDLLFETIARSCKSRGVGLILSGTGSDGARGIRAIKAEGGFTIALEPSSAKYDGMPTSAINTGNVDLILTPEAIGAENKIQMEDFEQREETFSHNDFKLKKNKKEILNNRNTIDNISKIVDKQNQIIKDAKKVLGL